MRLKKIISRFKNTRPMTSKLDRVLLKKVKGNRIPKFGQFKYIGEFLSSFEKTVLKIAILVLILSSISWLFFFLNRNKTEIATTGGEYIEAVVGLPKFINPLYASTNDVDSDLTQLIYSGLFRYNNEQKLLPELASKYTVSADKKTYEIELRKDVKWSDGKEFTANDVIFTFKSVQNPLINSPLLATFQGATVEKKDDYTVVFTLKEPFTPFLGSLTIGIIPAHIWQDIQPLNIKLAKSNIQPVGTGMWKFDSFTKDNTGNIQTYNLVPNVYYYKQIPYLEKMTYRFYPDMSQAINALKAQDVSALSFVPMQYKSNISNKNFEFHNFSLPQYTALFFNESKNKLLKDDNLRLALSYLTDKEKIKSELDNTVQVEHTPILQNSLGYDSKLDIIKYSVASSTKLIEKKWTRIEPEKYFEMEYETLLEAKESEIEAIQTNTSTIDATSTIDKIKEQLTKQVRSKMDAGQNYYWKDASSNILEITITTIDTPEYSKVAKIVADMWKKAGIKTEVVLASKYQMSEILKLRDYQILLYGEIIGYDVDPYPFWHSSQTNYPGLNLAQFSDTDVDDLLEEARTTADEKKRIANYKEFQEIFIEEIPAIVLYTPTHNMIINKNIKGVNIKHIFSPSERYSNISSWYIKTKKKWFGN